MTTIIFREARRRGRRISADGTTTGFYFPWMVVAFAIAVAVAVANVAVRQMAFDSTPNVAPPNAAIEPTQVAQLPIAVDLPAAPGAVSQLEPLPLRQEESAVEIPEPDQAALEEDYSPIYDDFGDARPSKPDASYVSYYVYAEILPKEKPADIVLASLKDVAVGTPVEEIKRASNAFGVNFAFMKAVAKIESDFDPKQRTGSYIGLFQLNKYEFDKYGSGDITSPRDNAIAAAYKFLTDATLFEWDTHRKPSFSDLYLIHQQGWQGAAEHVSHPERIAWKSMCATDEGKEKGERWCKRAIWANTLPAIKHAWKSVENLTSAAFVTMWRQRVEHFYSRYSEATTEDVKR